MIEDVSYKLADFLQRQRPIFLSKKEIDDSFYSSSHKKMKDLP